MGIYINNINWLLGIQIKCDQQQCTISLSQKHYVEAIIKRYGFKDLLATKMPVVPGNRLTLLDGPQNNDEKELMKGVPYMNMVGALRYATDCTRPDIAFTISMLARFLANPGIKHMDMVQHCFQYLKGTSDYWLELGGPGTLRLAGFSDADGSTMDGSKAISRSVLDLGNQPLTGNQRDKP